MATSQEALTAEEPSISNIKQKSNLRPPSGNLKTNNSNKRVLGSVTIGVSVKEDLSARKLKYDDDIPLSPEESDESLEETSDRKLRFGDSSVEPHDPQILSKGMRLEYGSCPLACETFLSVEEYAKLFVDRLIEEALDKQRGRHQLATVKVVEGIEYNESEESSLISSIGTYVCLLEWPTIEQFSVDVGILKIQEYISYWKLKEKWLFCINFLEKENDSICDFYRYEAIFSIPCKQYPIAQATASIYFTFELSNLRPKTCIVDLYYYYEGQRLKYKPGQFTFHEERLFHIVDAKIALFKTLTF